MLVGHRRARVEIDFWFDVVCPFAYLASAKIEALAAEAGATVRWRPVLLGGLLRDLGSPTDPNVAMIAAKKRAVHRDIVRQAAWLGVPLTLPDAHPRRTLDAMRLLCAVPEAEIPALAHRLFRAYWVDGLDVADRDVLRALCPDVDRLVADKQPLRARTAEAAAQGVFGVPTFGIGETRIWGVDRLLFVRRALGLPEDRTTPPPTGPPAETVEWFHDFASPFSYLSSVAVAEAAGPARLVARPILVGALFRELRTPLVPLQGYPSAKQAWVGADLAAWAELRQVPFRFPSRFPIRSVLALRSAIVEPRATPALYRAAWADDLDVADPAVVHRVLDAAGFDAARILAATDTPEVKETLRANNARAVHLGVFGVPTFRVDDALFFGQDRLHHVRHATG
jgi:2-hydroxychromene-2-carboxylate isomerase